MDHIAWLFESERAAFFVDRPHDSAQLQTLRQYVTGIRFKWPASDERVRVMLRDVLRKGDMDYPGYGHTMEVRSISEAGDVLSMVFILYAPLPEPPDS
jgi:hypothetical protein